MPVSNQLVSFEMGLERDGVLTLRGCRSGPVNGLSLTFKAWRNCGPRQFPWAIRLAQHFAIFALVVTPSCTKKSPRETCEEKWLEEVLAKFEEGVQLEIEAKQAERDADRMVRQGNKQKAGEFLDVAIAKLMEQKALILELINELGYTGDFPPPRQLVDDLKRDPELRMNHFEDKRDYNLYHDWIQDCERLRK